MTKKILFVCKHNRFRSKIAEAYFKKINENKKIKAYSAGVFKGDPASDKVVSVGKKLGLKINKNSNGLSEKLIRKMDIVVITADDVPASIFKGKVKKIFHWKIKDAHKAEEKILEKISYKIFKRVDKFIKKLK